MGKVETTAPQDASTHSAGGVPLRDEPELNLLLEWPEPEHGPLLRKALAISVGIHFLFFLLGLKLPGFVHRIQSEPKQVVVKKTPLYFPTELTQKAPNKGKVARSFELEDLLPPQPAQTRKIAPPATRPKTVAKVPPIPQATPAKPKQQIAPEPPQIAANLPPNGVLAPGNPAGVLEPQPPPPEAPKQTAEVKGSLARPNTGPALAPPKNSVQDVIQSLARNSQLARPTVGDESEMVPLPRSPGALPTPAKLGSGLELLSDPEGVDFKPYLIQVLSAVRRNWFAVIPESARMGRRGRVIIQFAINRDGGIPKLVITVPSGAEPLDRAAVAGISASNPLPPLPRDFKGAQIRLQFVFNYNMPSER